MKSKMIVKNLENIVSKANIEEVLMRKVDNIMRPEKIISEVTAELTESGDYTITQEVDFDTLIKWIISMKTHGWAKAYGGTGDDYVSSVIIAPNGDIIVAGYTDSFGAGNNDLWILRLNEDGNIVWQKAYGGSGDDEAYAVAVAPNGDIIVAGYTESFGAGNKDFWVLRLDENGNIKWQKAYGGSDDDVVQAVAIAENGDIIVAGYTKSFGAGNKDFWVLRLDENGNIKWQKAYGGSDDDEAWAVAIAPSGDIIVVGSTWNSDTGRREVWVLRLDENGNVKWQKAYGANDINLAYGVAIAPNGDIIVVGSVWGSGTGNFDAWVLRLDENGNVKWQKTYGGNSDDAVGAVAVSSSGDIIVAGITGSFGAGASDAWALCLDENGNIKWQKAYGGSDDDMFHAVATMDSGNIIAVGWTNSFGAGNTDFFVMKLDENGNVSTSQLTVTDTNCVVTDTNCTVTDTNCTVTDTNCTVTDTSCTVTETDCVVTEL